jgi:hypothetical protein
MAVIGGIFLKCLDDAERIRAQRRQAARSGRAARAEKFAATIERERWARSRRGACKL